MKPRQRHSTAEQAPPNAVIEDGKSAPRQVSGNSVEEIVEGVLTGDRVMLGKAITLIESTLPSHREEAFAVLNTLLPSSGNALRIGVTGAPGVGKSTLIDALGSMLADEGRRVAVLAIDPSSTLSRGSIMGDKTRMERLAVHRNAFIRPSPTAGTLGGVARKTREAMLACEAAGYDIVFIETVGVGQSETMVHAMVDVFVLLLIAGAGDQLQGLKRGIMELADIVSINKADGENFTAAEKAKAEIASAVNLLQHTVPQWMPPVLTCSALDGEGLSALWQTVSAFHDAASASGYFESNRTAQAVNWMYETVNQGMEQRFHSDERIRELLPTLEQRVRDGQMPATEAADILLREFYERHGDMHQPPSG